MKSQSDVNSVKLAQIMERMRSLGNFSIAKAGDNGPQIIANLNLVDMDGEEVLEGFYQLVEEDKIRSHVIPFPLGHTGSTARKSFAERRIVFSVA